MDKITLKTRILIYLSDYWKYKNRFQYPIEITQEGISKAIGITVSHVPRELNILIKNKLVEEIKGRVGGKEKRVNVYFLTPEGILEVERIKRSLANQTIHFNGKKYRIYDIVENLREMNWLEAINILQNEVKSLKEKKKIYIEGNFENNIVDRKEEIDFISSWMKGNVPFLALIGSQGIGKTSLIGKFVSTLRGMEVLMIQMNMQTNIEALRKKVEAVMGVDFDHFMKERNSLVILDNYYLVDDSIVDYLQKLIDEKKRGKMIISMREETPSYNRFYKIDDITRGKVVELKIKGLSMDSVGEFLGISDIEKLKIIFQMTGGKPSILKCIKNGDEEGITKNSQLTQDQAKFLLDLLKKS
ncbi:MAG: AAA family ATPase [Thermoplasmata archaeon]